MQDESSVPAAQKMMDVTLPIFPVEVQNTADSDDRSQAIPAVMIGASFGMAFCTAIDSQVRALRRVWTKTSRKQPLVR
jgi:hypothetical protein